MVATVSSYSATGSLTGKSVKTTAANGLSWTLTVGTNGDGVTDDTQTDVTVLNADGSTTETFKDVRASAIAGATAVTATSANGLARTITTTGTIRSTNDSNTLTDTTTINADGSTTETRTIAGPTAAWSKEIVQASANGLSKTTSLSEASDTVNDYTDQSVTGVDGTSTETTTILNRNGSLFETDVVTTSANGLSITLQSARNGSSSSNHFENKIIDPDGSLNARSGTRTQAA